MKKLPLRCLIIEDEKEQQDYMKSLIESMPETLCFSNACDNINDTIPFLRENEIDIIFLDLELSGNKSGLDFLFMIEERTEKPAIIITSGVKELIVEAVDYHLLIKGFLRKPFGEEKFQQLILELLPALQREEKQAEIVNDANTFSFWRTTIKDETMEVRINYEQIKYISVDENISTFHLENGNSIDVWKSLAEILAIIPSKYVCQIRRNCILGNKRFVDKFHVSDKNLILTGVQKPLMIGDTYWRNLKAYLEN